jgi:hypothetical protein
MIITTRYIEHLTTERLPVDLYLHLAWCSGTGQNGTGAHTGPGGEAGVGGGSAVLKPPATKRNFKNTDFVDTMTCEVSRDLLFGLTQPLKSADD